MESLEAVWKSIPKNTRKLTTHIYGEGERIDGGVVVMVMPKAGPLGWGYE